MNVGPAKARNQASNLARGSLLAFLDNDTKPDPLWLKEAVQEFKQDDIGAIQCKLLLSGHDNLIDSIGCFLGDFGFLVQRVPLGKVKDEGQFENKIDIFSTKSAGMLIRKRVFEDAGGFDPDYFIYNEESDLCWRVWLRGYRIIYVPTSIVYHESGTTKKVMPRQYSYLLYYHGSKNYILTVLKNVDSKNFLKTSMLHVMAWLAISIWMIFRGRPIVGKYILQGILWNLKHMKSTMMKRMQNIARKRKSLPKSVVVRKPLRYYLDILKEF
jgi:GT2 family glycosyltransferase